MSQRHSEAAFETVIEAQLLAKVKRETMIFPRYHQLQAVRTLVDAARCEGVGHNYLIEHSAGSGKSNTIGWLTHRLASLHNAQNQRVFDSVIVVTDRVVLDQQLQDTIYQFEHKRGVVQKIDESSRQLAEALENAVPVIITTLQKFPLHHATGDRGSVYSRRVEVLHDLRHLLQAAQSLRGRPKRRAQAGCEGPGAFHEAAPA
jgi:type I restriction enzyme R subunit